jgi:hypothetical protein
MAVTYDKIATYTAPSAVSEITFTSISASYTYLVLVTSVKPTGAGATLFMQLNSTASGYSWQMLNRTSVTEARNQTSNTAALLCDYSVGLPSTIFTSSITHIYGYKSTDYQTTYLTRSGNGSILTDMNVGRFANTAVVNAISIFVNGNNLNTGSTATLYGVLKA